MCSSEGGSACSIDRGGSQVFRKTSPHEGGEGVADAYFYNGQHVTAGPANGRRDENTIHLWPTSTAALPAAKPSENYAADEVRFLRRFILKYIVAKTSFLLFLQAFRYHRFSLLLCLFVLHLLLHSRCRLSGPTLNPTKVGLRTLTSTSWLISKTGSGYFPNATITAPPSSFPTPIANGSAVQNDCCFLVQDTVTDHYWASMSPVQTGQSMPVVGVRLVLPGLMIRYYKRAMKMIPFPCLRGAIDLHSCPATMAILSASFLHVVNPSNHEALVSPTEQALFLALVLLPSFTEHVTDPAQITPRRHGTVCAV